MLHPLSFQVVSVMHHGTSIVIYCYVAFNKLLGTLQVLFRPTACALVVPASGDETRLASGPLATVCFMLPYVGHHYDK